MVSVQRAWIAEIALPVACFIASAPRVCAAAPPTEERPDESSATPAPPPREAPRWYGWQTFAVDSVAGAIFLGAIADDHNSLLFGLSGVTFSLGAPAIHVAHGRWGVAVGSLGMRMLGPFVGTMIGSGADVRASANGDAGSDTHGKWSVIGAGIGGLVVSVIDGVILAYDQPLSSSPPRNQALRADSLPQLIVLRHGIALGYAGQF